MNCPYCNKIVSDDASECECGYKFEEHKEKIIPDLDNKNIKADNKSNIKYEIVFIICTVC